MMNILARLDSEKVSLRKKATNCLGSFAIILGSKQLKDLCTLLLKNIENHRDQADLLTQILCLQSITRTVGNKIQDHIQPIFAML
jgi:hypothetical protein